MDIDLAWRRARADHGARRGTEAAIQRCRGWCLAVGVIQSALYPGDRAWLGWLGIALVAATWAATGAVLSRPLAPRALHRLGVASMAADVAVMSLVLANLLRDPTDPVQMLPLVIAAEGAMRWGRRGGIAAGLGAGLMTATWSVVVHTRADLPLEPAFVTVRVLIVTVIGALLGSTVSAVRQHQRLATVVCDGTSDLIASFDLDGRIRSVNPACEAVLGYTPEQMVGQDRAAFMAPGPQDRPAPAPGSPEAAAPRRVERCFLHRRGHEVWLELEVQPDLDAGLVYVIGRDVSDRRRTEDELRHRADHDALTGAANRSRLLARLERELRGPRRLFLLYADLDGFKAVNDRHGHATGDAVLVEAVDRIRAVVRPADLVARLSGDELCVLLPAPVSEGDAHDTARDIAATIARPFLVGEDEIRVTASVGVAASLPSDQPGDVLERADQAMYERKRAHRARRAALPARAGGVQALSCREVPATHP
ncbi:MAG TPA: sensor domain-containing diguanylate cyclase [Acidimicrobiales bacterium]|nr:sensor domain-containing diguanylate cyclase [Acidimicrobiales bacterium]